MSGLSDDSSGAGPAIFCWSFTRPGSGEEVEGAAGSPPGSSGTEGVGTGPGTGDLGSGDAMRPNARAIPAAQPNPVSAHANRRNHFQALGKVEMPTTRPSTPRLVPTKNSQLTFISAPVATTLGYLAARRQVGRRGGPSDWGHSTRFELSHPQQGELALSRAGRPTGTRPSLLASVDDVRTFLLGVEFEDAELRKHLQEFEELTRTRPQCP